MPTPVSDLPAELRDVVVGQDLIVFDGECVLCSGFFRFMLRHDRQTRFRYALAQSPLGARLYRALGLSETEFETNLVIVDGRIYQELDAFAAAMRALGGAWRALAVLRWLPRWLKNPFYRQIARNRYAIFGRYDACMIPDEALRARFVTDGWG